MRILPYDVDEVVHVKGVIRGIFVSEGTTTYRIFIKEETGQEKIVDIEESQLHGLEVDKDVDAAV